MRKLQFKSFLLVLVLLTLAGPAAADYALNMTEGVTEFSRVAYEQHMIILWICVVIGVLVFGAMFVSIFLHRKSRGVTPAKFSHSTTAEILWTVIPILILVGMAFPATKALILMENTGESEMTVKITGFQWRWKYDYIEDDISFISSLDEQSNRIRQLGLDPRVEMPENYLLEVDNRLVLPTNTKIRFLLTADDVIHSWWVPALGWKRDAIPGFVNEAWTRIEEPGVYRGQCAELCGKDHGFMPVVVEAVSPEEYQQWVSAQKQEEVAEQQAAKEEFTLASLMDQGESVYLKNCASCHQADGSGLGEAFPAQVGSDVVAGPLDAHMDVIVNGVANTGMTAWGNMLSDTDIASVLTYTRNTFGAADGAVVQPRDVTAAKL